MAIVTNIVPYSASKNNGGLEFERQIDYSCRSYGDIVRY